MELRKLKQATPIFIIGNPRSGTSLLRLMLNAHPDICIPPESGFSLWLADKYLSADLSDQTIILEYVDDVLSSRKFETWRMNKDVMAEFLLAQTFTDYAQLATQIYACYATIHGKRPLLVGDKNNYYINHLEKIKAVFPGSTFIFIVRDGRDVACSYRSIANREIISEYRPQLPIDIETISIEWSKNNIAAANSIGGSLFQIKYEDLITSTRQQLIRICNHLEVTFKDTMLEYHKSSDEPPEFMQWKEKTMKPPDASTIGKYKSQLSADEQSLFCSIAGDALKRFGYIH